MRSFIFIIYGVLLILGMFGLTYMHESVHMEIYRHYGISSHIDWIHYLPDVATVTDSNNTANCDSYCLLAHNINEVVGYHLMVIYSVIGFALYIIIALMELRIEMEFYDKEDDEEFDERRYEELEMETKIVQPPIKNKKEEKDEYKAMKKSMKDWKIAVNQHPTVKQYHYKVVSTRWNLVKNFLMVIGILALLIFAISLIIVRVKAMDTNSTVTGGIVQKGISLGVLTININIDLTQQLKDYIDSRITKLTGIGNLTG